MIQTNNFIFNLEMKTSKMDYVDTVVSNLMLSFFKGSQFNLKDCDIKDITWDQQDKFLNQTIYSSHFKKYPCNQNFCRIFFKNLINQLEKYHEVHDGMYEFLCSVMKENMENSFSYQHYYINNNHSIITIKQTRNMVLNGTTGLKTWEAAFMLADWALYNERIFLKKHVLELGSGVGFSGITIAKYCTTESMMMSDHHPEVLQVINDNIEINFQPTKKYSQSQSAIYEINEKTIGTVMLDWNESEHELDFIPDIIIGADIVYDPSILKPLVNVLHSFYKKNNNIEIYIVSAIRNIDTFNGFIEELELSDFKYEKEDLMKRGFVDWDENTNRCLLNIYKN